MDKASKLLENLIAPQPQLLIGYQRISSNPILVGKEIGLDSSPAHHSLPQQDSLVYVSNQPLVENNVDLAPPSVVHFVLEESDHHISHVLLVSSDSHESKSYPPVSVV